MTLAMRLLLVASALVVSAPARAEQNVPFVTTDELKRMIDAKEDFVLANALSPIEFAEESIVGSVNVPYEALRSGKAKLPQQKSKKIVFYCKGPKCTKSVKAAAVAVKRGYTNVVVYNEGIPEWVKRGYPTHSRKVYPVIDVPVVSAADLKRMLDAHQNVVVLDVRDDDDAKAGRIPGSNDIDLEVLDARFGDLPRGKKIVLVDLHGKQTHVAGRFLASKGFQDVVRLDGGFVGGWIKAGYPVAR